MRTAARRTSALVPATVPTIVPATVPVNSFLTMFSAACRWPAWCGLRLDRLHQYFPASVYPQLGSANFDAPAVRRPPAARTATAAVSNAFAALRESAPAIAAPASIPSGSTLSFEDRFAAAAPQGRPQSEAPQLAEAKPQVEAPKLAEAPQIAAPKLAEAPTTG